jgi:cytochrome c oxidase cbb3-type subunit III
MRLFGATCVTIVLLAAARLQAQHPPAPPPAPAENRPAPPATTTPVRTTTPEGSEFDPEAVERGRAIVVAKCGFCHGSNARGGAGGSDLTRSPIVQEDEGGKQLNAFLKVGRPEKNMPKFELPEQEVSDIAMFLHATIAAVSNRGDYQILDIVVGDPKAGAAFFNGGGGCRSCHSPEGDLKGVGAKYDDPATLQGRMLMPRGGRRGGPPRRGFSPYTDANAVQATVTLPSGESVTGALVRLTDFDVTLYDPATQQLRSWLRTDDVPRVTLTDRLQAHVDLLRKWTDRDMHDTTAYLASLK